MQSMGHEYHRLALCSKPQYSILEQRLSDMGVHRAQGVIEKQ